MSGKNEVLMALQPTCSGVTHRMSARPAAKALAMGNRLAGEKYAGSVLPDIWIAPLLKQKSRLSGAEAHYRSAAVAARSAQGISKDSRAFLILERGRFLET